MKKLIGREREIKELDRCIASDQSEFIIVYSLTTLQAMKYLAPWFDSYYWGYSVYPEHIALSLINCHKYEQTLTYGKL